MEEEEEDNNLADLFYRLEHVERQQSVNTEDIDELKKADRVTTLEKIVKNNRALLVLAVVLSPLAMGLILYDFSAELKDGKLSGAVRSRSITFPDQAKTISVILGIGGVLGLSKDELIALMKKGKDE